MKKNKLLEKKVCLITGTTRGIGKSIVERFAEEGAIVYANARIQGSIDDWAKDLSEKNDTKVIPVYFDVTDVRESRRVISKILKDNGRINVLVNNAGITYNQRMGMISIDKMKEIFDINVFALTNLMQLAARVMVKHSDGSIINISSTVGLKGNPGQLAYSASKGAVIALTKTAAKELASSNIRVNSIAPGLVDTAMFRNEHINKLGNRILNIGMKRLAEPKEIADSCLFLASDLSKYVTGQIISVDGSAII